MSEARSLARAISSAFRRDDRRLGPKLGSDVEWFELVLLTAFGDRYRVEVTEDGTVVGLRWH